uniref:Umc107b(Croc) n=1 Tax=Arundo donax TaxID=35708 RepID=A0A0A9GU10_ARUDO
MSSASSIP